MKKKILKKGLIMLIVCILSIGSAFSAYAACAHTFNGSYETTKEPTCTATGTKVGKCTKCGVVVTTVTIPALGHSYGEWIKYTTGGVTYSIHVCTRCGHSEYK
ncbi:hypothetical protein [Ruminiclostridium papyrosolvens]|uniref:Uncharacterized protein n=1 Tax=Ruminiclostridium papyrosolvens C7 TaxID=1330534 RepID=U4R1Z4_9FIRM|nr:hypothetical protein [Ruminiclostridium papyrosolvens]EPR11474.1 hypothetical protein L323_11715 [Ruminiclostridium papyrosolvens C7]